MKYFLSLLSAVILSCNSTSKAVSKMNFPTGKYQLVSLNDENYKPQKDYMLNVNSEENRIGGTFDCNTFTVDFERTANTVKFGYAIATKMFCEGIMHNESAFFKSTQRITSFTYNKDNLVFYDEEENVVFELKYMESE